MRFGIFSGSLWGLDTVILAIGLALLGQSQSALLAAGFHDAVCALVLLIYALGARRLAHTWACARSRGGLAIMGAALLGGPLGMSGYLLAIHHLGAAYSAIISTFYPAVGAAGAALILKERLHKRQVAALAIALVAIALAGYSATTASIPGSPLWGMLAALLCVGGWGCEGVILTWSMHAQAIDNVTALQLRQTTSALAYLLLLTWLPQVTSKQVLALFSPGGAVITLAALAGMFSYLLYYRALATIGAARAMALNIAYSAWAIVFAFVLQGNAPSGYQLLCGAVILVTTVLAATPNWGALLNIGREKQ